MLILGRKRTEMAFCPEIPKHHPRVIEVSYEEARLDKCIACWRIAEDVQSDAIPDRWASVRGGKRLAGPPTQRRRVSRPPLGSPVVET